MKSICFSQDGGKRKAGSLLLTGLLTSGTCDQPMDAQNGLNPSEFSKVTADRYKVRFSLEAVE